MAANTWYYCTVISKDADGRISFDSNGLWGLTAPRAPKWRSAAAKKGRVTLSWKTAPGAAKYRVFVSDQKTGGYRRAATVRKRSVTLKNTKLGLKKGRRYYFRIRAVNANGTSGRKSAAKAVKAK